MNYASAFKALGDQTRVKIYTMLKENGQLCACKILEEFHITQPTLSYHMKMLWESGLVNVEKIGTWHHYSINNQTINELCDFLSED